MKFTLFALLTAFLLPLVGQEAKIIIIEKNDSAALKESYRNYKAALKQWEDAKAAVAKKYTTEDGKVMSGWEKVAYSVDFRALVPDTSTSITWSNGTAKSWSGITTPAMSNSLAEWVYVIGADGVPAWYPNETAADGIRNDLKTVSK